MDKKSFDTASLEIMSEKLAEDLHKALPPHLAAKMRAWFRQQGARLRFKGVKDKQAWGNQAVNAITQKMEEVMAVQSLRKNQMMARIHNDGCVKLDFGAEVPEPIRKAAIDWAKRKGLKPVEASLAKSKDAVYSVSYSVGNSQPAHRELLAQYVWEISN